MAKKYTVKLLRKEKIAKETWLFAFSAKGRPSPGREKQLIEFIPGQYMTITLPLPSGKTDWRDFTITSNPQENELWVVAKITDTPSEFKKVLVNLPVDTGVTVVGGNGGFTIDKSEMKPYVFIAGGIGVNVFRSMLTAKAYENVEATLLVSFSTKEYGIFESELAEVARKQSNKKIIYTFTNKEGRISKSYLKENLSGIPDSIYMIAGSPEFVDGINELLLQMEIPQDNIRIDYFSGYE